jgi:tetratricopeptide (TPR) repeat protein
MTQQRNSWFFVKTAFFTLAILIGGAIGVADSSFAASGGGSSSGSPGCKTGTHWDKDKNKCVKNSSTNDNQLYLNGRDLALAGRYQEALDILRAVRNPDSMTLTMIGYATRKLGNYNEGLGYYQKALAIDPNNVNTREYLGEAYAEKGQLDLAKAELVKIEATCGTTCEQYIDLAKAIAGERT